MNTNPTSLPDRTKSCGRRASHNEENTFGMTGEFLADRKGKRGVTHKFSKRGSWELKPQQNFKVTSTELRWAGQEAGKNQAILSKGRNASCH